MIKIKPSIEYNSSCECCGQRLKPKQLIWQGIHVCVETICEQCGIRIIEDLEVGHATYYKYFVNLSQNKVSGPSEAMRWLGQPLLESLKNPIKDTNINLKVEVRKSCKNAVIINCIDFLYGHALLKLLNADRENETNKNLGVIVIVQDFLKWLVPSYVAEVWSVNVPLSKAQGFYLDLNEKINEECTRFDELFVSKAFSHPKHINIENFTGIQKHKLESKKLLITFIWREDRIWIDNPNLIKGASRIKFLRPLIKPFLYVQKWKIESLFYNIRRMYPDSQFNVVGLGKSLKFKNWINDIRVERFNDESEKRACEMYADSTLIIGIHGSNMLLPSALSGAVINLMPKNKWVNYGQDILFLEGDNRLSSYLYRFLPAETQVKVLVSIINQLLSRFDHYKKQMMEEDNYREERTKEFTELYILSQEVCS